MQSSQPLVLGVDGGGTKTVAWLAPLERGTTAGVLGTGRSGPGNPRSAGINVARQNIDRAIAAAFVDAGLPRGSVLAACLGLAGAGQKPVQKQITDWANEQQIAKRVEVRSDPELALAAGTADNWGIALLGGTGSLAWGRTIQGRIDRCGGWGYLLGDEGSGYAITLQALQAAVRGADGRGEPTALLETFMRVLAAASPMELTERIYGSAMTPGELAQGAKYVFEVTETDAVAQRIVAEAADNMAQMVVTLQRRMGFSARGYPLALAGGVLVNQPHFRAMVLDRLHSQNADPSHTEIVADPVSGAVELARQLAIAIDSKSGTG